MQIKINILKYIEINIPIFHLTDLILLIIIKCYFELTPIPPYDSAHYVHTDLSHITTEKTAFSLADGAIILHMIKQHYF